MDKLRQTGILTGASFHYVFHWRVTNNVTRAWQASHSLCGTALSSCNGRITRAEQHFANSCHAVRYPYSGQPEAEIKRAVFDRLYSVREAETVKELLKNELCKVCC